MPNYPDGVSSLAPLQAGDIIPIIRGNTAYKADVTSLAIDGIGVTDHEELTSIGLNSHDDIDSHLANTSLHSGGVPSFLSAPSLLTTFGLSSVPTTIDLAALCPGYSLVYLGLHSVPQTNDYIYGVGNHHDVDVLLDTRRLYLVDSYYTSALIYLVSGAFWAECVSSNFKVNYPGANSLSVALYLLGGFS